MKLSSALLGLLRCPVSGSGLIYFEEQNELLSLESGLAYPVLEGVPIMLESQARKLSERELKIHGKLEKIEPDTQLCVSLS